MMNDELISRIMDEVMKSIGAPETPAAPDTGDSNTQHTAEGDFAEQASAEDYHTQSAAGNLTEFVGTAIGHTIGLVIANLDSQVHDQFEIDPKYRAVGIVGSRNGAAPQIFAADEAVKATNTKLLRVELARDGEGGAGHGCLIIFGSEDVSDARRAVEVCLQELETTFGEVYENSAGHLQFQYTARASDALHMAYGASVGKSFGITIGAPAAIGVMMADTAVKSAPLEVVRLSTPGNGGTSFSNEVALAFSGDSGAVKQAIITARDVGMQLLKAMEPDEELNSVTKPYIL